MATEISILRQIRKAEHPNVIRAVDFLSFTTNSQVADSEPAFKAMNKKKH